MAQAQPAPARGGTTQVLAEVRDSAVLESGVKVRRPAEYMLQLDALRAIAVFAVMIEHFVHEGWIRDALPWGMLGVRLFFVLSGFLITGILMRCRQRLESGSLTLRGVLRTFFARRFLRLMPVYYVYLAAAAVLLPYSREHLGIFALYAQNFLFAVHPELFAKLFAHFWSLAVEEQFYLTLPALIRWISPRVLPALLLAGIVAAPLVRLTLLLDLKSEAMGAVYALLPCRMDSLLIGVLLAMLMRHPSFREFLTAQSRWIWRLLAILTIGMIYFNLLGEANPFPTASFGYTWIAIFYATILVLALTQSTSLLARFLRNRWLRGLGVIAYGTYLIHVIVFTIVMTFLRGRTVIHWLFVDLAAAIFSTALSIAIAQISWLFFEKRFVRRRRRLSC
jgi:peptidoglycan/LPS O-acetylase OafA/YrhL